MDEVHIISYIYMDEVGIHMLISMSQYTNGDQGSNKWNQSIQMDVHNGGLNGRVNKNKDMKNLYIETMAFTWNGISQKLML